MARIKTVDEIEAEMVRENTPCPHELELINRGYTALQREDIRRVWTQLSESDRDALGFGPDTEEAALKRVKALVHVRS